MSKQTAVLLVANEHDLAWDHVRIDWSHVCDVCHQKVAIFPAGQNVLGKLNGAMSLICTRCADPSDVETLMAQISPGVPHQLREQSILQEVRRIDTI